MKLSTSEKQVLLAVLDMHLEEMDATREDMIEDRTLDDLEVFSSTFQQHDGFKQTLLDIKKKLQEEDNEPGSSASGVVRSLREYVSSYVERVAHGSSADRRRLSRGWRSAFR